VAELIVLVHSPVLGPASWQPVAGELARSGWDVAAPLLAGFADDGPPYAGRLVRLAAERIPAGRADRTILVTHSGAGVFAGQLGAAIRAATGAPPTATILALAERATPGDGVLPR
jgi:hypothetical protein